ncbi:hypothetical protein AKH00_09145 [Microbacterium sp. GCS4]|nr:hypothetical protein AKH00_09145 [Microbacterium sp. GCS4]
MRTAGEAGAVGLAIDIGQTQARIRVLAAGDARGDAREVAGEVAGEAARGAAREIETRGFVYGADLLSAIPALVRESTQRLEVSHVAAVAVGSTGVHGRVPPIDGIARELHRDHGVRRTVVADDAVTAYLGARGEVDGVVVAAGTGMVGLGLGPAGAARVDGVGGMIGDEGAGWWIGRRGLIAAISASDGRPQASPALLERLESRFGPVAGFPGVVAADESPVALVASFAKDVAEVARAGDPVATSIWREAGAHIAGVVVAGAVRSGLDGAVPWVLLGRLGAADDLLRPGWDPVLASALPGATRVAPEGMPLDGVARLLDIDTARFGAMVRAVEP